MSTSAVVLKRALPFSNTCSAIHASIDTVCTIHASSYRLEANEGGHTERTAHQVGCKRTQATHRSNHEEEHQRGGVPFRPDACSTGLVDHPRRGRKLQRATIHRLANAKRVRNEPRDATPEVSRERRLAHVVKLLHRIGIMEHGLQQRMYSRVWHATGPHEQ